MTTKTTRAARMATAVLLGVLGASGGGCVDTSTAHPNDGSVSEESGSVTDGKVIEGRIRATDGTAIQGAADAVRESAANDLKCSDGIDVKDVSRRHTAEYVAVGCGYRILYRITYAQDSGEAQVVELTRSRESTSSSPQ